MVEASQSPAGDRRLLGDLVRPLQAAGPALEKAVAAAKGAVKLVKIDVDKNPAFAGQLRVQSIPTVYRLRRRPAGRRLHGRAARQPGEGLRRQADRQAARRRRGGSDELLAMAAGVHGSSATSAAPPRPTPRRWSSIRKNVKAIGGLARCFTSAATWSARAEVAGHGAGRRQGPRPRRRPRGPGAAPRRAGRHGAEFEKRLAGRRRRPRGAARARQGAGRPRRLDEAARALLNIIERDREWNEGAARKQLLTVFEAAGPMVEVAKQGRRRLSAILFS